MMTVSNDKIDDLLRDKAYDSIAVLVAGTSGVIRRLVARLYHQDEEMRMGAARAMETEKVLDLLRRLQWMMSDESGSNCWNAPHAMGEIGYHRPDVIDGFLGNLNHFAGDPDQYLSEGARYALERIVAGKKRRDDSDS